MTSTNRGAQGGEQEDDRDSVYMACPACGDVQEDYDGFGVQFCEVCRYCTHSSISGDTCDLCGKTQS